MSQTPSENIDRRIITGGSIRGEAGLPSSQSVNDFHGRSDVDSSLFAQHHTLGTRREQAASGDHTHDGTSSKLIQLTKSLSALQTKWSIIGVVEDITGFFFDVEPNTPYAFEGVVHCQASADATFTFVYSLPAGSTIRWTYDGISAAAEVGLINRQSIIAANPAATPAMSIDAGLPVVVLPKGVFVTSTVGGRVQIQLKRLSGAGTLTVFDNSTFEVKRVVST